MSKIVSFGTRHISSACKREALPSSPFACQSPAVFCRRRGGGTHLSKTPSKGGGNVLSCGGGDFVPAS